MNPDQHVKRNLGLSVLGETAWGIHAALIAGPTVLAVLLQELGASEKMIGSIESIQKGLLVLPQLIGLFIFTSQKYRKRQLLLWHMFVIIPFIFISGILIQFTGLISDSLLSWGLLLSFAGFFFTTGIVVSVWLSWQVSLFKQKVRGTALGFIFFASALIGTLGALVAGRILELFPERMTYSYLYFAAGTFAIISTLLFWFVIDPVELRPESKLKRPGKELFHFFKASLKESNFRQFLIGRLLGTLGFSIVPFIAVYFQSTAGGVLSSGTIVACGSAMLFGTALSHLLLGRLGDHFGHRLSLIIGICAQICTLVFLIFGSGKFPCVFAYFGAGINGSAVFLSHTHLLIETCRHDNQLAHLTLGNLLLALPILITPIFAGILAESAGLTILFNISLIFSVLAILWFLFFVKEPRKVFVS